MKYIIKRIGRSVEISEATSSLLSQEKENIPTPVGFEAVNLIFKPFSGCGNHSSPIFRSINEGKAMKSPQKLLNHCCNKIIIHISRCIKRFVL